MNCLSPRFLGALAFGLVLSVDHGGAAAAAGSTGDGTGEVVWLSDYGSAAVQARDQGKMLLVLFARKGDNPLVDYFESTILTDSRVSHRLREYVCVKVPLEAEVVSGGAPIRILDHASFCGMQGQQGISILDFVHRAAPYYGRVVSALPFSETHCYSARQMGVLFDLAPGTLAERNRRFAAQAEPMLDPNWLGDYEQAVNEATRRGRMLLVFFCDSAENSAGARLRSETMDHADVRKKLQDYVCLRLPLDAKAVVEGKEVTLLEHEAFREMLGQPGVAIVDYAHKEPDLYGRVVSAFPVTGGLWYTPQQMAVILDLPPGTLTQRTLIYAVRIHPERPASTSGALDRGLVQEAESHSNYQARTRRSGHHNWGWRFQRIVARLPGGLTAKEICAESWPGQNLVEAAIDCVRCWRLSSGHWSAVRSWHHYYGYDMKRGSNGIWYATGIFGGG